MHIQATPEFHRIKNLPRRKFDPQNPALLEIRDMLTEYLKTPNGTQTLLPVQAFVLKELFEHRGFIGAIPVGQGKTHSTALAPTLLECERPLLIVPAKHAREKTPRDFRRIGEHWRVRDDIQIVSYESIGVVSGYELLFELKPDLLILDEMQYVKNRKGVARTKRIERYVREHRPRILGLSGTFIDTTLLQAWHILYWALPYTMPLPRRWYEAKQWADAAEGDPYITGVYPGVLTEFCGLTETLTDAIGRRIVETPGVVASNPDGIKASLTITAYYPQLPEAISATLDEMRDTWEVPGGEPFSEAVTLWRHMREGGCGLIYHWRDPAPRDWLDARRTWEKAVRETLKYSRTLDSKKMVALACERGKLSKDVRAAYAAWKAIRGIYKPVTVPIWISDYLVDDCAEWLANHPRGIVWCDIKAFASRLSEKSGCPYFCKQGRSDDGTFIENHKGPCIASPIAIRDGYNLQYNWNENRLVTWPGSNEGVEQVLGRTHRQFQESDEVIAEFVFTVQETIDSFKKVILGAKEYKTVLESKLLYADYVDFGFEVL